LKQLDPIEDERRRGRAIVRHQSLSSRQRAERRNLGNTRLRYRSQKQQRSVQVMFDHRASPGMPYCLACGLNERGPRQLIRPKCEKQPARGLGH
jgi:hypothetical protein